MAKGGGKWQKKKKKTQAYKQLADLREYIIDIIFFFDDEL